MAAIAYFGGKSGKSFKELINSNIPKDGIRVYIEPFSGSMGTYMDDDRLVFDTVIYNDKNKHQVNLYKCCSNPERLLHEINNLMLKDGLLYTELADTNKKWDFYKNIYREYVKNDFLDNTDFDFGVFKSVQTLGRAGYPFADETGVYVADLSKKQHRIKKFDLKTGVMICQSEEF